MDLLEELKSKLIELQTSISQLRKTGSAYAQAEHDYRVALSKEALLRKDKGEAVTSFQYTLYGLPSIAKLRFERDVAEVIYNANQESVNATKIIIKVLENQIAREWHNA